MGGVGMVMAVYLQRLAPALMDHLYLRVFDRDAFMALIRKLG
jgi:hypothetical protein